MPISRCTAGICHTGGDMTGEERLEAFEKMLETILSQYRTVSEKMAALKAEGKERPSHTASFLPASCSIRQFYPIIRHMAFGRKVKNSACRIKKGRFDMRTAALLDPTFHFSYLYNIVLYRKSSRSMKQRNANGKRHPQVCRI